MDVRAGAGSEPEKRPIVYVVACDVQRGFLWSVGDGVDGSPVEGGSGDCRRALKGSRRLEMARDSFNPDAGPLATCRR